MKKNKSMRFLKYIVLIGSPLLMTACSDFLDEQPKSSLTQQQVFSDKNNMNSFIKGLYKQWRDAHKGRRSMYLGTDESACGSVQWRDDVDKRAIDTYNNLTTTNSIVLDCWKKRYAIITGASSMLQIQQNNVAEADSLTRVLIGEASFLRAENYFELAMMYGPVPIVDYLNMDKYGNKRQPLNIVYDFIRTDLERAVECLPAFKDMNDPSRASKRLAYAMLGKLYLYADPEIKQEDGSSWRDYQKAGDAFQNVIAESEIGTVLPGSSNPEKIFGNTKDVTSPSIPVEGDIEVEKEWIYAFRFQNVSGDLNACQWYMGSRAVSIMSTTGEALCFWAGFDEVMPTEYCWKLIEDGGVWDPEDKRRHLFIRGINQTDSQKNSAEFDDPRSGWKAKITGYCYGDELEPHITKFEDPVTETKGLTTYYSARAIPFIRMSDIFLNYAECLYHTKGATEAIKYINPVLSRAGFKRNKYWSATMIADENTFMEKIMDERMRELCFEGWRKFDLLRTGFLFKPEIMKRNKWFVHDNVGTVESFYRYWPIPLDEINKNIEISLDDQNLGY